jgi:tetratricopeptide (TPR) repeat protein
MSTVTVRRDPVVFPTYLPAPADKNPMFLEKRVYQGSSGKVYPLPFTDRIALEKKDRAWDAVHLENAFIRVMILPELGGRVHVGQDKTNGYDFFYRQNVIKPALVGLAGPWISGGVEFNWPQHHRPSTFMPADLEIEEHGDGSVTVWLSEHEPMNRMKGMHGVCLHPEKAYIELKGRVYNRTPQVQTFLWWANVATRVNEQYQSFFPPDASYVADHAKRAMSAFPLCGGTYYGIDYARRAKAGVSVDEMPAEFVPGGDYPANDLSWYANIPVPTSYMCMGTAEDFFGGYDHAADAGVVHVANHHIAPGKKQWTWGNHAFGYAWDRNLTDADGPYIELMAGVYTDNQPDFSFLMPGETKTWSQFWYPIQKIGPAQHATVDGAVSLRVEKSRARVGVSVSSAHEDVVVRLMTGKRVLRAWTRDLAPGKPFVEELTLRAGVKQTDLRLTVLTKDGRELVAYAPKPTKPKPVPPAATEPAMPGDVRSNDELFITGLHLEQYRHATREPDAYWREALRRDPGDSRCAHALGRWHLRRGEFVEAERLIRVAIERLTSRNPNPYDGEPHYNLGLALRFLGREDEAYAAFYKATWNHAWQGAGYHALAELDCIRGDWTTACAHIERALRVNLDNLRARNLRVLVLRKLGRADDAEKALKETRTLDPLDWWARALAGETHTCDTQVRLDVALDFARAGFMAEALELLAAAQPDAGSGTAPLVAYYRAWCCARLGRRTDMRNHLRAAAKASPDYCFPARLEEIGILEFAIAHNPADARAPYYLGNLFYDGRRHAEAIRLWESAAKRDGGFPVVWRNLGIGYFNIAKKPAKARAAYERALRANPGDARLLYERDQLWKRLGEKPSKRLRELEKFPALVAERDDLSVELCALYNLTGHPEKAREILATRKFQPWEGGEGQALGQHVRAHLLLGRAALAAGDYTTAISLFSDALRAPENLGEAKHLLANQSDRFLWLGEAYAAAGDREKARTAWTLAAAARGDFQDMRVRPFSEMTWYSARALERLGKKSAAKAMLGELLAHARVLEKAEAKIDYFATSLPTMLLFDDDLQKRQKITARFLQAQALDGLGRKAEAARLIEDVIRHDPSHALAADFAQA